MGEADNRKEFDGKGLFIIRNGKKIAKYEAGKWVPLLPGVVVRKTPDGIKIEMPHYGAAVTASDPVAGHTRAANTSIR